MNRNAAVFSPQGFARLAPWVYPGAIRGSSQSPARKGFAPLATGIYPVAIPGPVAKSLALRRGRDRVRQYCIPPGSLVLLLPPVALSRVTACQVPPKSVKPFPFVSPGPLSR